MSAAAEREAVAWRYQGSGWLARQLDAMKRPAPSPLGLLVGDILGEVYQGIYHVPNTALFHERTQWHNAHVVKVTVSGELANHDGPELTWLVLLAHAHGVRLAISGAAPGYLRLQFTTGEAMWFGKLPDVARVVARFDERYPRSSPQSAVGDPA